MDNESLLEIIKVIERVKKIDPEIVITHFPEDLNIDHQIVSEATMTAFRPKARDKLVKKLLHLRCLPQQIMQFIKKKF